MTEIHKKYTDFISVMVVLVVLIPTLGPGWEHFSPSVGLFYSLNGTDLRCRGSFRVR